MYNRSQTEQQIIGTIGETIVGRYFGLKASENVYDSEKDLFDRDGNTYEVKTQMAWRGMLTIGNTQYRKCTQVAHCIFVEYGKSDVIRLWRLPERCPLTRYTTSFGKQMVGFKKTDLELIHSFDDPYISELLRHYSNDMNFRGYRFCLEHSTPQHKIQNV